MPDDVDAVDHRGARLRADQRGQHLDGGGLAGAVRAEQRRHGARRNGQVESVERVHRPRSARGVGLPQSGCLNKSHPGIVIGVAPPCEGLWGRITSPCGEDARLPHPGTISCAARRARQPVACSGANPRPRLRRPRTRHRDGPAAENAGHDITVAPGNAGIAAMCRSVSLDPPTARSWPRFAADNGVELVVDRPRGAAGRRRRRRACAQRGIPVFGPGKAAAAARGQQDLRQARSWRRPACRPVGRCGAATLAEVDAALDDYGAPYVVKADGLAAGKGVLVTEDRDAALAHAEYWLRARQSADRGVPRRRGGVALPALRRPATCCRCRPRRTTSASGRRRGPEHGRDGRVLAAAVAAGRIRRRGDRHGRAADGSQLAARGHAVRRAALLRADPDGRGHPGHRVQRALRRSGDAGRAAPAGDAAERPAVCRGHRRTRRAALSASSPTRSPSPWCSPARGIRSRRGRPAHHRARRGGRDRRRARSPSPPRRLAGDRRSSATGGRVLSVVATASDFATARSRAYRALDAIGLEGGQYRTDIAARVAVDPYARSRLSTSRPRSAVLNNGSVIASDETLPGWTRTYSGKVRDLYTSPEHPDRVLMVASDRVSAFDHLLEPGIPGKGELLTTLSLWWFDRLDGHPEPPRVGCADSGCRGRPGDAREGSWTCTRSSAWCAATSPAARWAEYQTSRSICGVPLPEGLQFGDRLPEPIFTPAFKAPLGEHDENISFERTAGAGRPGRRRAARTVGRAYTPCRGDRRRSAASCSPTPSSSSARTATRASPPWPTRCSPPTRPATGMPRTGPPGAAAQSFDKQIVRNWLVDALGQDRHPAGAAPSTSWTRPPPATGS